MSDATYRRVERAIRYISSHATEQPDLAEVARVAGLSPFHFQRVFARWAGVSPKRFLQCLTLEHAKRALADSRSLLDAALEAGLSGPGRLHDLFVTLEAVTPGEYKAGGAGLAIRHGFHGTPFGECLLAVTDRGVCALKFVDGEGARVRRALLDELRREWPGARHVEDAAATRPVRDRVFAPPAGRRRDVTVLVRGTPLQVRVWRALLAIPEGSVASYGDVARWAGSPHAARAVGQAVGANRVAVLIPCHRVIRESGALGGYRWGLPRKRALLAWERAAAG